MNRLHNLFVRSVVIRLSYLSSTSPQLLHIRSFLPSGSDFAPIRVGLLQFPQRIMTLERWIFPSISRIPPFGFFWLGRVCFLRIFSFSTTTVCFSGRTCKTLPSFPFSLPVMTRTRSPFRIFVFVAASFIILLSCFPYQPLSIRSLQNFRRQRNNLREFFPAQLPGHRSEDAGPDRLSLGIDQDRRISVELDVGAVFTTDLLRGSHHHRLDHLSRLNAPLGDRFFDRRNNNVAEAGVSLFRAPLYVEAHHLLRTGVIGHVEHCVNLYHSIHPFYVRSFEILKLDFLCTL